MLITEMLRHHGANDAETVALVERDAQNHSRRELTWDAFDAMADQVAVALMAAGIRKGDRAAILMTNSLEWLPIYFGILRAGIWAVPLNFRFDAGTIKRCIETVSARALFFGSEFVERIAAEKAALDRSVVRYIFMGSGAQKPDYATAFDRFVSSTGSARPAAALKRQDIAAVYFTSGTTGHPKGVVLTHQNLAFAGQVEREHHQQSRGDIFLCIPPLYHTGAKMHWFGSLAAGGTAVLLKGVRPHSILQAVSEERATIAWLLVPWAHDILTAVESGEIRLDDYRLDQWRLMHIGAQPVAPSLIRRWRKVFPNQAYDTNYGLTEATGPGCVHLGCENLHKVGAIGVPGHEWRCRIVDDNQRDVPDGTAGELAVMGAGVMQGYYGDPQATAAVMMDGWLLTGDIARKDEDGFIWLVDRKKDVIISGGENIFPVEIENFILEHARVQDAAVIGVPDMRLGEIVAAVVQPKPGRELTEEEMVAFCAALPRYKRPRRIFFNDIPRNPTGKIQKPLLRKWMATTLN